MEVRIEGQTLLSELKTDSGQQIHWITLTKYCKSGDNLESGKLLHEATTSQTVQHNKPSTIDGSMT